MGLLDIFKREKEATKAMPQYPDWTLRAAGQSKFNIPRLSVPESQQRLYQKLSWVAIAVERVASSAAGVEFGVKELDGETKEELVNHPYELLLQRPNPRRSRFEFLQASFMYYSLTGNCYWWLNKANEDAAPDEQFIIPSHRIEPVPDEQMYIKGYTYDPGNGEKIPLEPWEVVHFKRFNPFSPYVGMSAVEALAIAATADLKMSQWNANFFGENNAKMPGVLAFSDPISDSAWAEMKDDFKEQHGGTKRNLMMLRNVGEGGVSWVATAMSQQDMQFLEARKFNKMEIFDMFAPGYFSWTSENATEANSRAGRDAFFELAVWPLHQSFQETVSNKVLPLYGDELVGEFKDVRPKNRELEMKEIEVYARYHTVDEVREKYYQTGGIPGVPAAAPRQRQEVADEKRKFRKFAQKRVDEGNPKDIAGFKFDYVPPEEQEALKAEYMPDDLVSKITEVIDVLREQ